MDCNENATISKALSQEISPPSPLNSSKFAPPGKSSDPSPAPPTWLSLRRLVSDPLQGQDGASKILQFPQLFLLLFYSQISINLPNYYNSQNQRFSHKNSDLNI